MKAWYWKHWPLHIYKSILYIYIIIASYRPLEVDIENDDTDNGCEGEFEFPIYHVLFKNTESTSDQITPEPKNR